MINKFVIALDVKIVNNHFRMLTIEWNISSGQFLKVVKTRSKYMHYAIVLRTKICQSSDK